MSHYCLRYSVCSAARVDSGGCQRGPRQLPTDVRYDTTTATPLVYVRPYRLMMSRLIHENENYCEGNHEGEVAIIMR